MTETLEGRQSGAEATEASDFNYGRLQTAPHPTNPLRREATVGTRIITIIDEVRALPDPQPVIEISPQEPVRGGFSIKGLLQAKVNSWKNRFSSREQQ